MTQTDLQILERYLLENEVISRADLAEIYRTVEDPVLHLGFIAYDSFPRAVRLSIFNSELSISDAVLDYLRKDDSVESQPVEVDEDNKESEA